MAKEGWKSGRLMYNHIYLPMDDGDGLMFCFFTVNSSTELIITSVLLALSLAIIGDAFRKYWRIGSLNNRSVTFVYRMIFAWWTSYLTANLFGIVLFSLYDGDPTGYTSSAMSESTKYSFVISWANAFVIQWVLIYVPYHWAKKITDLFCYLNDKSSEMEEVERTPYNGYESSIYIGLKYYIRGRLVFLLLPVLFLSIPTLTAHQAIFKLMVASLLLDCIVIIVSLVFGMISLKTTEQLKLQLDEIQSKRMVNQYLMITLASILRFGFDFSFVISKVIGDESFEYACPTLSSDSRIPEIVFNISECIFTHYLPIFIILRIYNLEEKPEEIARSLLVTGENESVLGMDH